MSLDNIFRLLPSGLRLYSRLRLVKVRRNGALHVPRTEFSDFDHRGDNVLPFGNPPRLIGTITRDNDIYHASTVYLVPFHNHYTRELWVDIRVAEPNPEPGCQLGLTSRDFYPTALFACPVAPHAVRVLDGVFQEGFGRLRIGVYSTGLIPG